MSLGEFGRTPFRHLATDRCQLGADVIARKFGLDHAHVLHAVGGPERSIQLAFGGDGNR